jgi:hypothetical protein
LNYEELKMDNQMKRIIGGVFIALHCALPDENARLAEDVLFDLSESPKIRSEDRYIYKLIAESATRAEIEANELAEKSQPRFRVIEGGSAA